MPSVIFDMDGVLVDSNALHFEAFQALGVELGVPFTQETLDRTIGMHNNQIFPFWIGSHLTADEVSRLALKKESLYRELAATRLLAVPGAVELVRKLHSAGVPIAVGSSGPRANVELALSRLQIRDLFGAVVTGDDVQHGKPDPEIFLKAAGGLSASPSSCFVIEDAQTGIQAGLRAGMTVIAVTTSLPASALTAAHRIVESLSLLDLHDFR